jgi:signal transduction histidine kinase
VDRVPESGHYGIRGMRERAERIGGELSITSEPGSGTRVAVAIPLPSPPEEAEAPHV